MDDRVIIPVADSGGGTFRMSPVRPTHRDPPGGSGRTTQNIILRRVDIQVEHRAEPRAFCLCDVTGRVDEHGELSVRHGHGVDAERPHGHVVDGALTVQWVPITVVVAASIGPTRQYDLLERVSGRRLSHPVNACPECRQRRPGRGSAAGTFGHR